MTVPYTFSTATSAIPLSNLDANFATAITLGNTAVYLGNTTTSIGNLTLANVTISSVSAPITVAQGGTGLTTITANGLMVGNTTGNITIISPGATGNVLVSTGTTWSSTAPTAQVYPGAGIANSTGTAWGTSYTTNGSGTVVALITSPTFVTPTLGVATATSVNKVAITAPASSATLTLANGSTLVTVGAFSTTVTATNTTAVTLPTSGTIISSTTALSGAVTGTPSNTTYLRGDATWATVGAGGTPGGSNTQVQYNNSSSFGGSANFTFDGTNVQIANSLSSANTFGFKNRLIDAGFIINQRGYVSGTSLSSGSYGHDRWKGGAGGGTYTFTQGNAGVPIVITITTGAIQQVIEGCNVPEGGTYVLSWVGTATASINGGSSGSSPLTVTGATAGANMTIQFNTGTVSYPQLETGTQATSFDYRDFGREYIMCQRYFYQTSPLGTGGGAVNAIIMIGGIEGTSAAALGVPFPTIMRAVPSVSVNNSTLFTFAGSNAPGVWAITTNRCTKTAAGLAISTSTTVGGQACYIYAQATDSYAAFSAEL